MNDITFCRGEDCILKQKCYRFTAQVFGKINMFDKNPFNKETKTCEHFKTNHHQIERTAYFLWKNDIEKNNSEYYWTEAKKFIQNKWRFSRVSSSRLF